MENQTYQIMDDSGFLAVVNAEKYNGYIADNWTIEQITEKFVSEMNNGQLLIWQTGSENEWKVEVRKKESGKKAFREFRSKIEVTNKILYITNYEDLSMVAQFMDESIPSIHNSNLKIELENGMYYLTVRQLYDPENFKFNEREIDFELIFNQIKSSNENETYDSIIWS